MVTITWAAIVFAILKMIFSKWKKQELVITGILLVLGLLVFVKSRDAAVLLTIISICAAKNIDLNGLFKYSFWLKFGMFLTRTMLALKAKIERLHTIRRNNKEHIDIKTKQKESIVNDSKLYSMILFMIEKPDEFDVEFERNALKKLIEFFESEEKKKEMK